MGTKEGAKPSLAKLQKQVAERAEGVKAPEAGKPAGEAAKALEKGDLAGAIEEQKKALGALEEAAKKEGQEGGDEAKGEVPAPSEAKNAGELAKAQKALLKATEAMARSKEATKEAEAALGQAEAQAPSGIMPPLEEADKELGKAEHQLEEGQPATAQEAHEAAAAQLEKALQAAKAIAAAMPHPATPAESAVASAEHPGEKPEMAQGQKPSPKRSPVRSGTCAVAANGSQMGE